MVVILSAIRPKRWRISVPCSHQRNLSRYPEALLLTRQNAAEPVTASVQHALYLSKHCQSCPPQLQHPLIPPPHPLQRHNVCVNSGVNKPQQVSSQVAKQKSNYSAYNVICCLIYLRWRHQSEQLRQAIAASRSNGTAAPSPAPTYGMVQCPHCSRKFNEQAGERHIPICEKTKSRPVMLKSGSGAGGGAFSKNRR